MRIRKLHIVFFICLFTTGCVFAQRSNHGKSRTKRTNHNFRAPVVRGHKAKIICPIFESSAYPYHGIGLKVGDPFAMTYKFYPNKHFSFALDFGKAASGLYNRYFREKFYTYTEADTFSNAEASLIPITHKVKSDFVGEVKLLYHFDADKVSPGLQVYVGGGWEWKSSQLQYDYTYNDGDSDPTEPDPFGRFERNRFAMGPQVVVGIEYAYFQLPISAFMELEYFADIQADPGWLRFEGGIGLRYIF